VTRLRSLGFCGSLVAAGLALNSCNANSPTVSQPAADTRAADEAAIRAADAAWSKAAGAKDAAATASFYADNAVLMAPGGPASNGKDAILKGFTAMMADKNFALSFAPAKIEVAKSSDLAYDLGDFSLTVSDPKGKAQTLKGKYVVVWGKQSDGSWKALVDCPSTAQ
jgi:uncharacterized protein (TIGR02246 family)